MSCVKAIERDIGVLFSGKETEQKSSIFQQNGSLERFLAIWMRTPSISHSKILQKSGRALKEFVDAFEL